MSRCLIRCLAALPPLGVPRVGAFWRPLQATNLPVSTTTTTTRLLSFTRQRWQDDSGLEIPRPTQSAVRRVSLFGSSPATGSQAAQSQNTAADLSTRLVMKAFNKSHSVDTSALHEDLASIKRATVAPELEPHHLHIFAHKHNTHVTFTHPNRNPIISMSCGNVGYRKGRRGSFDSAYSLMKHVLERLVHTKVRFDRLELVLRGFGPGRGAAIKVLTSPEGKTFREKIIRVADSTRLKFGGTRSPKRRRI